MKCLICHEVYDTSKKEYGWHSENGSIRHCTFKDGVQRPMCLCSQYFRYQNETAKRRKSMLKSVRNQIILEVQKKADTKKTKINAAEVSRVASLTLDIVLRLIRRA